MLSHYGVDVLAPKTSLRRMFVLLRRLPAGTWPDESLSMSWSVEAHLLAGVLDSIAALTFVTIKAAGGRSRQPRPLARPGDGRAPVNVQPVEGGWAGFAKQLASSPGVVTDG